MDVKVTAPREDERTRFALDAAGIGEWDFDFATRVVHTSPLHDRCFGYREPVTGWNFERARAHVHPDDRAEFERTYREALTGEAELDHEFRVRWQDGSEHWLWARGRRFADPQGRPARFTGIITDVSARHRAQAAAQLSEARMRDIIEAAPVPFLLCNTEGRIVYLNPACVRTFGYTQADVPTHAEWWRRCYPDARYRQRLETAWERRLEETLRSRTAFEPMDMQVTCRDGTDRSIIAYAVHLAGSTPQNRLSLVVLYDVTEQRQLERSVLEAASFEQRRLGMDLHDGLGQQLTGLSLMLTGLARSGEVRGMPALAQELARLSTVANDCVSTARAIAHGLAPIEIGRDGFEQALRRLAAAPASFGGMGIELRFTGFGGGRGLAPGIAEPIYRIVQEALTNAAKHGAARQAVIEAQLDAKSLTVTVTDDGSGIRFPTAGDGLGLRIMQYRINALRGHLEITSPTGGGTVVRCVCPLRSGQEALAHG
jgi:PAS domain S-box-containing protein